MSGYEYLHGLKLLQLHIYGESAASFKTLKSIYNTKSHVGHAVSHFYCINTINGKRPPTVTLTNNFNFLELLLNYCLT